MYISYWEKEKEKMKKESKNIWKTKAFESCEAYLNCGIITANGLVHSRAA